MPAQANTTIPAPLGHIPVYVRGGSILPLQQAALTTRDARNSPWDILVALAKDGSATGKLYLDDGISVTPDATLHAEFKAENRKLETTIERGGWVEENSLRNVTIWGVEKTKSPIKFNGKVVPAKNVHFDGDKHTLVVSLSSASAWVGKSWSLEW
jgi:alpha-glucosidase